MKLTFFVLLPVLVTAFAKNLRNEDADHLSEIRKMIELTKTLDAQKTPLFEAFPELKSLKVDSTDVNFVFYNQEDPDGTKVEIAGVKEIMEKTKFSKDLKTIFLVHGWHNTCESIICSLVHTSLMKTGDFNYITVCWDGPAAENYLQAVAAVPQVGKYLGEFVGNLSATHEYDLSKIMIVGHSLGAHIAGLAGKEQDGQLSYIIGLDPAGPLFNEWDTDTRLDTSDAQYVQAIHSDGVAITGLGVNYPVGNVDFWPNGGAGQPGCENDLTGACSHGRSYELFAESINENKLYARKCSTYEEYTVGACKNNPGAYLGGYEIPKENLEGNYYLETASSSPYGLGDIGL